jgi:4-nitrophenyl phosphatase
MKELLNKDDFKDFIDSIDTFLLDCDGVLWHGNEVLPGIKETLAYLRQSKKRLIFVTNNSTKSREGYLKKFKSLGIEAKKEEIVCSSYAAAVYISKFADLPKDRKIYVIGERGICDELDDAGLQWVGGPEADRGYLVTEEDRRSIQPDDSIGAVLMGFDNCFNYRKLSKAHCYIRYNSNCEFYATNDDATLPIYDKLFPGTGCNIQALATATGRKPLVFGKPNKPMMDAILKSFDLNKSTTCMVGDRLNTDIQFGLQGGLKTLLVLTGVTQLNDLNSLPDSEKPHFYTNTFADLLRVTGE